MNSNLLMDFSVNEEKKQIYVKREFAASQPEVWAAWTQPELLDQWWAPRPYVNKTKTLKFEEGGYWLYSMTSPEGEVHWCRADYKKVNPEENYEYVDAFCDSEGKVISNFPNSHWKVNFREADSSTIVNIVLTYNSLEELEKIIEMGFKEGFTMAMGNLDEVLENRPSR